MIPLPPVLQQWHRVSNPFSLLTNDASQETSVLSWLVDAVEPAPSDGLLDSIDEVVKSASQVGDVFAIKWSHEGAVERVEDLVSNLVALMFEVPHASCLAFYLTVVVE